MSLVESSPAAVSGNAAAYSVSELAFALKRTIEDAYGFVRVRGEISKVTRHASGHIYLSLKDDRSTIDGVVWKGSVRGLQCQPETGLEVIVTGKITTYPARSSYQMVIETMEPAGVGALLAQLERLKTQLRAEGLFEAERKKALPASPAVIGVITSPTGAVIRDILHRIRDRWPCRVIVWPVVVQGADAASQVAAAVRGFNALDGLGALPRPDIIVVARGGGSVEDLWPFNDEALARTVAASFIPLISAVGHETDTTLIDFVSDRRAPTPTAAAEMATPVLADLRAEVLGLDQRMVRAAQRLFEMRRSRLEVAARGLPRPEALLGLASQRFDMAAGRLAAGLTRNVAAHERDLVRTASRLNPTLLSRPVAVRADRLAPLGARLSGAFDRLVERREVRLERAERLLLSLHPEAPLRRGFALVRDAQGQLVRTAAALKPGQALNFKFADGSAGATVDGAAPKVIERKQASPKREPDQGNLF
jgi:exodeoxyribonuclease VII large subunit